MKKDLFQIKYIRHKINRSIMKRLNYVSELTKKSDKQFQGNVQLTYIFQCQKIVNSYQVLNKID